MPLRESEFIADSFLASHLGDPQPCRFPYNQMEIPKPIEVPKDIGLLITQSIQFDSPR